MSNEHNNAPAVPEQELSALLTTSLPYMTPVGRARLGQDIAQLYSSVSAPAVPQGWTDADSDSARLALELECLLMDTKDLSVVSKWWASANEALELHRQRLAATPAPAPAQEFNKSVADAEIKALYVESQGSDKGWLGIEGSYFIGGVVAARKQTAALAPAQDEPFGHFRAEPFGWTDCAKDDEGAIALYEHPMADPWRDAVLEQLESWHIYVPAIHDNSPRMAIKALVNIECKAALDPAVSSEAAALAAQGVQARTPAVPQGWRISKTRLDGREATIVNGPGGGCVACKDADIPRVVPESILYDLATTLLTATPAPAPAQERCSTCGYLTSEREHLGCLRRAVKDLDIATGGPYDAQGVGLTDEEIEAIAKKHMSTVGDHWCNEEAIREIHAEDFARDIIAALLAKWGQMTKPADCPVANEPCQCMCMDGCALVKPKDSDRAHPYVSKLVGCGHGVLFTDYCKDCEIVALQEQYRHAVRTVQRVRDRLRVLGSPMPGQTS